MHNENSKSGWNVHMRKIHPGLSWRIVFLDIDQNLVRKMALIIHFISSPLGYDQFSNKRSVMKKT